MRITRRRNTIVVFITLGAIMVALAIALNVAWVIRNWRELAPLVLGIPIFGLLIAGVILNTIFLVREVRRNERHDSFLNAVTHELKTPVASIRLYLETLQRRTLTEEQRQQFYGIMLADSDRLIATVEQVLKAGEVGLSNRTRLREPVDLLALVRDCVTTTKRRHHLPDEALTLDAGDADLHTAEPDPNSEPKQDPEANQSKYSVRGNPEDLKTAVLNILDNAIKYSPHGVHVKVRLAIENDAWIRLSIADQGLGIPAPHLKRVFKRFYRVPTLTHLKVKGTGLGLFLVRSIARQHGGDAQAESSGEGHGTTISLQLPRFLPPQPRDSPTE